MMAMPTIFAGADIGASNVKLVYGSANRPPEYRTYGAGAAPVNQLLTASHTEREPRKTVMLNGEEYVCLENPLRIDRFGRAIGADYYWSDQHRANVLGILDIIGAPVIDILVVGLPTMQYERDYVALEQSLVGEHTIRPGHNVTVKQVIAIPQPVGAWFARLAEDESMADDDVVSLIVDAGYYTVDWVRMLGGEVVTSSSYSSVDACSLLLDGASRRLIDRGVDLSADRLEWMLQRGREYLTIGGEKESIHDVICSVAEEIAGRVIRAIKSGDRDRRYGLDRILISGGGARYYHPYFSAAFDLPVHTMHAPVRANVRGYWRVAQWVAES